MSQYFGILKLWHVVVTNPTEQMIAHTGLTSAGPGKTIQHQSVSKQENKFL